MKHGRKAKAAVGSLHRVAAAVAVVLLAIGVNGDDGARDYVITFKNTVGSEGLQALCDECNADGVRRASTLEVGKGFKALKARLSDAMLGLLRLKHGELIDAVEEDAKVSALAATPPPQDGHSLACPVNAATTNGLWGLSRVVGNPTNDGPGGFSFDHNPLWGRGVDVYVIDTGVNCDHAELRGRCILGFASDGGSAADDSGHGTHVAGTVAGAKYGVAKAATVIAVRALRFGDGTPTDAIKAINYTVQAQRERGRPGVINMSLGWWRNEALNRAVASAVEEGGLHFAVAAGNDGGLASSRSPASAEAAITVGSTDIHDAKAGSSNDGPSVDIFAPGVDVLSADYEGGFVTQSGTSMASPHVAGVVAAYVGEHPTATTDEVKDMLTETSVKNVITGDLRGAPNRLLHVRCTGRRPIPPPLLRPPATCNSNAFDGGVLVFPGDLDRLGADRTIGDNVTECWKLECSDAGHRVVVNRSFFSTEARFDQLVLFNETSDVVDTWTGTMGVGTFVYGPSLTAVFTSDRSVASKGFELSLTCQQVIVFPADLDKSSSEGTIGHNVKRTWEVGCDAGRVVKLTRAYFSTDADYDFMRIYDESGALLDSWTGDLGVGHFTYGSSVTIEFTSDGSFASKGFELFSTCEEAPTSTPEPLGTLIVFPADLDKSSSEGTIGDNVKRTWELGCDAGRVVKLTRAYFSTDTDFDFVRIYDESGAELDSWSGNLGVGRFTYRGSVTIEFTSDDIVASKGFELFWACDEAPAPLS